MTFQLPQQNLRAKDLPEDYLPHKEILQVYKDAGQEFNFDSDASIHDRNWRRFHGLINANMRLANQEIEQQITGVYRTRDFKDGKAREWIMYHMMLLGLEHKGEQITFDPFVGKVTTPIFTKRVNPDTEAVEYSGDIHDHKTVYNIPFTKEKVDEISRYFIDSTFFVIVDRNGRKQSCTKREFRDLTYDELLDLKTGFTEFMRTRKPDQLKGGGVR